MLKLRRFVSTGRQRFCLKDNCRKRGPDEAEEDKSGLPYCPDQSGDIEAIRAFFGNPGQYGEQADLYENCQNSNEKNGHRIEGGGGKAP